MKKFAMIGLLLVPSVAMMQPAGAQTRAQQASAVQTARCDRFVANPAKAPEARSQFQAMTRNGDPAMAAFAEGCLATAARDWNAAAKAFERAVKADDAAAVHHYWLGRTYATQVLEANVLRQASLARKTRAEFERAVHLDPDFVDARIGLMQYYLRAPGIVGGSVGRAREQVLEVRRRNAFRGGMVAATVERRVKNYAAAISEYERLIAQYPDSAAPYSSLASTYGDQRLWDDAFRTIDRFLTALPREILAQYAVGRAAAESGQQLDRGEQALRRYIAGASPAAGEPTVATAHLRLGTIFERQGKPELARTEYQTAIRLEPTLEAARAALKKLP